MHADRQPHGIMVTLYRGKVVTRWSAGQGADGHRTGAEPGREPGAHARAKEAESWRKLAGS